MNSANHPLRIAKILIVTFFVGYFSFLMIPKSHAISYLQRQRCDYVFSEYAHTQIDRKDYPECSKRFDYLTKRFQSNFYSVGQ